jgi:hypothetical protein
MKLASYVGCSLFSALVRNGRKCERQNMKTKRIRNTEIFLSIKHTEGPSLWSSGQSSCLQIQRSEFDSHRYQIFCEGLERGPLRPREYN